MIDPARVRLFIPNGLKGFKQVLFDRIASKVGGAIRGSVKELAALPDCYLPVVGCTPELRPVIDGWLNRGRQFAYWDRGYARRVFATWLPRGDNGGYYRWHLNGFQMQAIKAVPADRWNVLQTPLEPWRKKGRHIVVALPTPTYERFHGIQGWRERTLCDLARVTDRPIVLRDKESKRPLQADLADAHCLVAHGSNAAVEAAILGCPVFVDVSSAAALVGLTDTAKIEAPVYPDRDLWAHALAYSQFNERELVDGTLWRLIA